MLKKILILVLLIGLCWIVAKNAGIFLSSSQRHGAIARSDIANFNKQTLYKNAKIKRDSRLRTIAKNYLKSKKTHFNKK